MPKNKPIKLAMSLVVRDEINIIKSHIAFHLPKVDLLIITDNGSKDGTREFLDAIEDERIVLISESSRVFLQAKWVNRMVKIAAERGMNWVINSDADEFWLGDLRAEIIKHTPHRSTVIRVPSYMMRCTYLDNLDEKDDACRILWRDPYPTSNFSKPIHAAINFRTVQEGNHDVSFTAQNFKREVVSKSVRILHYAHRGWEHFRKKYIRGGKVLAKHPLYDKGVGAHWVAKYAFYCKYGEEGLMREFMKEFVANETQLQRLSLVYDSTVLGVLDKKSEPDIVNALGATESCVDGSLVAGDIADELTMRFEEVLQEQLQETKREIRQDINETVLGNRIILLGETKKDNRQVLEMLSKEVQDGNQQVAEDVGQLLKDNRWWSRFKKWF